MRKKNKEKDSSSPKLTRIKDNNLEKKEQIRPSLTFDHWDVKKWVEFRKTISFALTGASYALMGNANATKEKKGKKHWEAAVRVIDNLAEEIEERGIASQD